MTNKALDFFRAEGVKLVKLYTVIGDSNLINNSYVGINAIDIMKKNEVAILGLIWHCGIAWRIIARV